MRLDAPRTLGVIALVGALLALTAFAPMAFAQDEGDEPPPFPPADAYAQPPASPPSVVGPDYPPPVSDPWVYRTPQIDPCAPPCPPTGCAQPRDACGWPLDWCGNPYGRLEITLEATYSFLDAPEGHFGEPAPGVPDPMRWDVLDYEGEFGARGGIRYAVAPNRWIEARGGWYGSWEDSARETGQFGFLPGPGGIGGVSDPNSAVFESESEVWTAELNYITELMCEQCVRLDGLIGVRYLQFNETARARDWIAPFPGFNEPAFVESDVENTFFGLQLGAVAHWDVSQRIEFYLSLKGMIGNVNRDIVVNDRSFFAGGPHSASSERDEIVFGGDAEVGFKFRVTPRIAITGGYQFLFLDSIVRAHDAMDFTMSTSGAVQARQELDQLIVHAFFLGLNFNF